MDKPYTILHMLISIDGKITGDYLSSNVGEELCQEYYRINREYKADAYLCGRITMEGSFTGGKIPDLSPYKNAKIPRQDFVAKKSDFYAVSIDPSGKLGWYGSEILDEDSGYNNAHIIEVLTDKVSCEYLAFLQDKGISYIFCGQNEISVELLKVKLYNLFGIKTLLVEGGGLTDSLFLNANALDELSLVLVPMVDGSKGIDLFANKKCNLTSFNLKTVQKLKSNGLWLNYTK